MSEQINKVLVDRVQSFSTAEQAQARANIGAQAQLTAGSNVSITNNVISATDTTYTAGTGISINNNVISTTGGEGAGVFVATYNSTTYAEISNALAAGDAVILRYGGADIPISSSTSTRHAFLQVRRDVHSYAQQTDNTRAFVVSSSDVWEMNSTPVAYNIIAGAGLTYGIVDNDLTLSVSASYMPDLQLLQNVTVDVGTSTTTLNIENGKAYYIRITDSVSPIITLSTNSITTIHSMVAVKNTSATACADVTLRFTDEMGYQQDVQLMMYEMTAEYDFYVDIRKISNDTVIARVYDLPCMWRKGWQGSAQYTNDTAWIGYVQ